MEEERKERKTLHFSFFRSGEIRQVSIYSLPFPPSFPLFSPALSIRRRRRRRERKMYIRSEVRAFAACVIFAYIGSLSRSLLSLLSSPFLPFFLPPLPAPQLFPSPFLAHAASQPAELALAAIEYNMKFPSSSLLSSPALLLSTRSING